jgi:hypothetical protein
MSWFIADANIFIDFEAAGIVAELFRLPERIAVPDLLFEAELRARHLHLLDHGLVVLELSAPVIRGVEDLAIRHPRPGRLDLTALALAADRGQPLLTGDRDLREAASREGVTCHGSLWIGERLVVTDVLTVDQLARAYALMRQSGRRLPWERAVRQIDRLRR